MSEDNIIPFKKKNPALDDVIQTVKKDWAHKTVIHGVQVFLDGNLLGTTLFQEPVDALAFAGQYTAYCTTNRVIGRTNIVPIPVY